MNNPTTSEEEKNQLRREIKGSIKNLLIDVSLDMHKKKFLPKGEIIELAGDSMVDEIMADVEAWKDQEVAKARIKGASIAATEINRELGLDLTDNGEYYLNRHQLTPTKEEEK